MYEHRHQALLPHQGYVRRLKRHVLGAIALLLLTLGLGIAGYHWLENLSWIDAYVNAAMILGGMGPVAELHTSSGKLFAGTYALFAGLVFLLVVGLILTPVLHRALHRFHLGENK